MDAAYRDVAGRVHLAVDRDPATGRRRVTLKVPVLEEAWQNEIASAAADTAVAILGDAPDLARAVALAQNAMDATSRLAEGLLARAPAGAVACRAGCDHCCYQVVGATPPEVLAIFDHLRRTLSAVELEAVAARVAELQAKREGLSADERFSPDHPCPFLRAGRCTIYEVRPLSCRGMNSLDAGECERRLRDPEVRAVFLASGAGGRVFLEPIRGFHAVSAGLQLALAELYHLDMHPVELTAAIHLLFTAADAPRDWLGGRSPFPPTRTAPPKPRAA